MKAQQSFDAMVEDKINTLMPYLVKTARGDEDLIQEGAIGIWESMKEQPYAANKYHTTKAKWNIINVSRGVGRSVDIPKQYEREAPNYPCPLRRHSRQRRRRPRASHAYR